MTTCYQKHPFEIENEDRLTTINTKIFEIKKKIQLSEGQRKSCYEENEQEKQQNNDLIETLKKEIKLRLSELAQAKLVIGEEEVQVKKYLTEVCPIGNKTSDQIIHNLDLKVIEQRKMLDLLKYEKRSKNNKLRNYEKEYEHLLVENTKGELVKSKSSTKARKKTSHLENEIHKVLIQWTEAELVKKKYYSIRQALIDDSVKFESSLTHIEEALNKQKEEIVKLEKIREVAAEMRVRATAATSAEAERAHDAEHTRAQEKAYFAQRFAERKRELEKLEKRIFPPQTRVVRQESTKSDEGEIAAEEDSAATQMEAIFQRLMKLTGANEAEEVFDRFQGQRETSQRLNYLQQTIEEEKLQLEEMQTSLISELEAFKFASVKDKDEGQEQINDLKEEIKLEVGKHEELQKTLDDLEKLLLELKRLLYDLCKLLDVIPDPPMPEWTAEARDVQELITVLTARYEKAVARAEEIREKQGESTIIAIPSNPTSRPSSVAGLSASHSTPKESEKAVPTYKELVSREPVKAPQKFDIMFCPNKNAYLQLVCSMNPRVINKAVDKAMERSQFDPHCNVPVAQRLTSMQPSLYAPHVDITRAKLGFGRNGLRLIVRDLHAEDNLIQLQALHSVLDQVQISENALYMIKLQLVYRLIDLMLHRDPVVREKICLILTHLATYYQGKKQIMTRPDIIENLMWLILRDRKEIRFAAATTLKTLARDRCSCEFIMKNEKIVEDLLKMIKNEHAGIVILHLRTLANLAEWDPTRLLKANAFQIMLTLFIERDTRIVSAAMDCMTQLCKDEVGKILADEYDLTFILRPYLMSTSVEVIISAVNLMAYTTLTTRSKWRAKECLRLPKRLVDLCHTPNKPVLQLGAMQVLMNLCDIPDMRNHIRMNMDSKVKNIKIRNHEDWDGTTETSSFGLETGHNYRTMCIEKAETIKNDFGDNALVINVHSYLRRLQEIKDRLIFAVHKKPYKH